MTAASKTAADPHPLPQPDPYLLLWDEMIQMPRILWAAWMEVAVDTLTDMLALRTIWPQERR